MNLLQNIVLSSLLLGSYSFCSNEVDTNDEEVYEKKIDVLMTSLDNTTTTDTDDDLDLILEKQ